MMPYSLVLRLAATICFALAVFINPIPLVPLGLCRWVASTLP